ncbi:unnamed protein product [Fraxinus pennsylvanica]|uniref:Uncharacterized protein n=1 Tax=Fraxinus pennsylvanica TaxID=56036 RepID=A0AAD1Z372_9LAMI|nr:unnamed protein product [Fraxinus pennsylvanica]
MVISLCKLMREYTRLSYSFLSSATYSDIISNREGYFRVLDFHEMNNAGNHLVAANSVFEDYCDADDAIRGRDGYDFDGHRLRGRGSSYDRYSNYNSGGSRSLLSKRSDYRVLVTRLPSSASWQDLKDHMH